MHRTGSLLKVAPPRECYPSLVERDPGTSWNWKQTCSPRLPGHHMTCPPSPTSFLFISGDPNTCPHPGSLNEPPAFFARFLDFHGSDWFVVHTTLLSTSVPTPPLFTTSSRQTGFSTARSNPAWSTEHIQPRVIRLEL